MRKCVITLIQELYILKKKPLAGELPITERSVRKIIANLDGSGYIEKSKRANRNIYTVNRDLKMRRPAQCDVVIGDLPAVLTCRKGRGRRVA